MGIDLHKSVFTMIDNQADEKVPEPIFEDWIRRLEAVKKHKYEDCAPLIKPITQYLFGLINRVGFRQVGAEEINKLFYDLFSAQPEIISTGTESLITAEFLAAQIKPWIEDIRQGLFHSKSAPFRSVSDAKKWLDEVNKKRDEWNKRVDEWHKEVDEWHKRADEWEKKRDEWDACWQVILEEYPHLKGGIEEWSLMKKGGIEVEFPAEEEWQKLTEIQHAAESLRLKIGEVGDSPELDEEIRIWDALTDSMFEIDKVTGFTWESLEMYILVDALPVLPAFTVGIVKKTHSLPSGVTLSNRFASVTIRGNLTDKDLRSLYNSIRRELGTKHSQPLKLKDLELYKMVAQRGSIPKEKGEIGKFWGSIKDEWNSKHPNDPPKTTWKGFQSRYQRIIARLDRVTKGALQNERQMACIT